MRFFDCAAPTVFFGTRYLKKASYWQTRAMGWRTSEEWHKRLVCFWNG
jgi:hypothetical protein